MKRSQINKALKEMESVCEKYSCFLPPFCSFTPQKWLSLGHEYDEVRDCMLGWDITDFGSGDFDRVGFSLITIRNGLRASPEKYPKVYAEKLLYLKDTLASRVNSLASARSISMLLCESEIERGAGRSARAQSVSSSANKMNQNRFIIL